MGISKLPGVDVEEGVGELGVGGERRTKTGSINHPGRRGKTFFVKVQAL